MIMIFIAICIYLIYGRWWLSEEKSLKINSMHSTITPNLKENLILET